MFIMVVSSRIMLLVSPSMAPNGGGVWAPYIFLLLSSLYCRKDVITSSFDLKIESACCGNKAAHDSGDKTAKAPNEIKFALDAPNEVPNSVCTNERGTCSFKVSEAL